MLHSRGSVRVCGLQLWFNNRKISLHLWSVWSYMENSAFNQSLTNKVESNTHHYIAEVNRHFFLAFCLWWTVWFFVDFHLYRFYKYSIMLCLWRWTLNDCKLVSEWKENESTTSLLLWQGIRKLSRNILRNSQKLQE